MTSIPVWLWLRLSSPAQRLEVARAPLAFLASMSKLCSLLGLGWWFLVVQGMFWTVWVNPACFWYAIPLLVSAGILGYALVGEGFASPEGNEEVQHLWQSPEVDQKWPRQYRLRAWQHDLALALIGPEADAGMQAAVLEDATPDPVSPAARISRL